MPRATDYGVESVEEVVTQIYGLLGNPRGFEYDIVCPNPDHNDSRPSCSINLDSGYWNCFSCGVGGDIVALGVLVLGKTQDEVIALLKPTSPDAMLTAIQRRVANNLARNRPKRRKRIELPEHPRLTFHEELEERGLTRDTVERWGLAWVDAHTMTGNKGEFTIRDSIAIPVRDERGQLLCWCYRRTRRSPAWQPKYLYTPEVEISEIWYGLEHYTPITTRVVTIVEGALDTMWLGQCGFPALGLLGSKMGDGKIMWLQNYEAIYTLPDHDNAGAQWLGRVTTMLGPRMPIRLCQYRKWMMSKRPDPRTGKYFPASDPEELRQVDLEIMHATAPLYLEQVLAGNIT
jgi:DNA primase